MKDYGELSKNTYDKKANAYEETFDGRFTVKFKELLLSTVELGEGFNVLDVACGTGTLLHLFSKKEKINGYGIDISPNMIHVAQDRYENLTFQVGDSSRLPFREHTFDLLTVCASFHHFPNPEEFAKEAARVLKPGGKLYIAEVYLPFPLRTISNFLFPFLNTGDVKLYSPGELKQIFSYAGFSSITSNIKGHIQLMTAVS